jgi:DNA (cytosine-5)-methyltransferase 1
LATLRTPRLLDLFCGAGGASYGYHAAGFDVVGVDINPQPRYLFEFHQADALEFPLEGFDAIHASPPCQAHSPLRSIHQDREYPDLIEPIRRRLLEAGVPFIIENVPKAPLDGHVIMLCGTMFNLQTPDGRAEIRRHRRFELGGFSIALVPSCRHGGGALSVVGRQPEVSRPGWHRGRHALPVTGTGAQHHKRRTMSVTGATPQRNNKLNYGETYIRETFSVDDARAAMGIDWMPMKSLSQAIPPAYTEFIGRELLAHLTRT